MRRKREKRTTVPARYRRYRPEEWDTAGQWVAERETWNAAQPPVVITGTDYCGMPWRCVVTPLGDQTSLVRARREARLTAYAGC